MVVPCGEGNVKVQSLIEQAAMRYKKAIAKVGPPFFLLPPSLTSLSTHCTHTLLRGSDFLTSACEFMKLRAGYTPVSLNMAPFFCATFPLRKKLRPPGAPVGCCCLVAGL